MPHRKKDEAPVTSEKRDSPTIQYLIEQLNRDLEDCQRKASKAQ